VDARFAGNCPARPKPSAEQVAAMLGLVAAGGFEATIKAQEILLAHLLPALAAREELLGRVSDGAPPVRVSTGALPAQLGPRRPVGPA
jgi:hypothetical protein